MSTMGWFNVLSQHDEGGGKGVQEFENPTRISLCHIQFTNVRRPQLAHFCAAANCRTSVLTV